jgi:hypothetical protein
MYLSKENHLRYWPQNLEHCIPVKIELGLKGILPRSHSFQGGERFILFQIDLFS